jgi:hypothetical protein
MARTAVLLAAGLFLDLAAAFLAPCPSASPAGFCARPATAPAASLRPARRKAPARILTLSSSTEAEGKSDEMDAVEQKLFGLKPDEDISDAQQSSGDASGADDSPGRVRRRKSAKKQGTKISSDLRFRLLEEQVSPAPACAMSARTGSAGPRVPQGSAAPRPLPGPR